MPYGAQITDHGVRFRLWAPGCKHVGLRLAGGQMNEQHELILPMDARSGGWFESMVAEAGAGIRYGFDINGVRVPDPASRFNPDDVHGLSEVIDPSAFAWRDAKWRGRPWEEAVIYELHVGTFSPEGTFRGVSKQLDYLAELGVTTIELMPVADFPGSRNWGYDGVLPYAPDSRYGRPDDLKELVQAAHDRNLMVLLDVVYNHFGPEGNYLHLYAKEFFTERHHTPWGAAINFDGPSSREVRDFFIHNALYWLQEYHFDGLRLDAVHAIIDDSSPHILVEIAERVRAEIDAERHVHLILENDANNARYLTNGWYDAQWNDDIHHALHVLSTQENDGYYMDYADNPVRHLGRCLTEGFAYQGEISTYRDGAVRGEVSIHLPPQAFVSFLQSHDQVGNRAFGERISHIGGDASIRAAAAIYLLAPSIPMLFMGEEFAAKSPFLFFCDFGRDLREAVTQGRRKEFARFTHFGQTVAQMIPDPNAAQTFRDSKIDWDSLNDEAHSAWLEYYSSLIKLRKKVIVPRLRGMKGNSAHYELFAPNCLRVCWQLGDASTLRLLANFSDVNATAPEPSGQMVFASPGAISGSSGATNSTLAPRSVVWMLEPVR
ncbi:MAG TPA: malto-oligosyltrehalose trehalohydrolase [Nitrosospira sp.]|nr:malto-oligosyltrehalose trehalohydrolase [Nitrosospira sp.]